MKFWIVGSSGLLGSTLADQCEKLKLPFVATSRAQADITDFDQLKRIAKEAAPTHILNCAAFTDVDGAEAQAEKAFRINAEGAENVARVAASIDAKLIHISTNFVFDGKKEAPYLESDPCAPLSIYGQSKQEGESRVLAAHPAACIIRTAWLYGRNGKNFISSLFNLLKGNSHLRVVADQWGSPTFCEDLATAVMGLRDACGVYHFGNRGACSRYDIAQEMLRICHEKGVDLACQEIEPVSSSVFPMPAERPKYAVLDTVKIEKKIGTPRAWQTALKEYMDAI